MIPTKIDIKDLSDAEAKIMHDFFNARMAEVLPDDPPIPFEERLKWWRESSPHDVKHNYVVREGDTVLGTVGAAWRDDETENPDTAWAGLDVAPEFRRRGIGTIMLRTLLEAIEPTGHVKLFCATDGINPDAEPFMEMIGAKRGLEEHMN
jgi:RimJ/RimL family protein N-acetyltransferase